MNYMALWHQDWLSGFRGLQESQDVGPKPGKRTLREPLASYSRESEYRNLRLCPECTRLDSRYNRPTNLDSSQGEEELNRPLFRRTAIARVPAHVDVWKRAAVGISVLILLVAVHLSGAQPQATSTATVSSSKPAVKKTAAAKPTSVESLPAPLKSYGSVNAPIKMEVFTDYQCPSCRNMFEETLRPLIQSDYITSGKVYLVHHDFPLPAHMYGYEAARWVNAAARVGQFQNVEAALYDNQNSWQADGNIQKYVAAAVPASDFKRIERQISGGCEYQGPAGVKPASLKADAQAGHGCALDTYIEQDRALGMKVPVQATPTYVITYKGNKLPAGSGFVSWPILKQFFDSLLSQ